MVASGGKHRPRCFFDIAVNGTILGRVTFELFTDICPLTCENFRALCTGEKGNGKTTEKPLHYKGTPIHRVVKDFIIQGGDFSAGNGTGGESIYGGTFSDENFDYKHDRPFLLSMANRGKDTNGSQFFITTKQAPHLDGIHTVFGQLIMGSEVVQEVENQRVDNKSRPVADVRVTNCGELVLKMKAKEQKRKKKQASSDEESSTDESSSESSESEDEKEKRKKKRKQKEKEKEQKKDQKEESVKEEKPPPVYQSELASNVTIDPEQIPEIPTNRFLLRRSPLLENVNQRVRKMRQTRTRSGRKIKGRGPMRYRTPSRSRSRSVTPPHWRIEEQRGMGNPVPDQWKARGPGLRRASLGTIQDDRWEMGNALQPARPDNRRREPPMRRQSDSFPDQPRPRNRDIAIRSPRGPLSGRLGIRIGRVEREPPRQREAPRQREPLRRREVVEESRKNEKGKEKEKKVEKEKKHKKEKDKSHKKHKKHKKPSDKEKHKDHSEEAVKRKRVPSPKPPRSRSPKRDRGRVRSPKRGGAGGDGRRRPSSPSPRDARRNASGGHTQLKTNNGAAKSESLSPPPSRWKPGQKPWKPSDTNKHTGKKNDHTQPSVADQRNVVDRSPSLSIDERSPSPVTLRRHGPNRSPSPRHLSPQRDQSSPSRSPLPLTRRQDWPTSPSERVKLAVFPPSSPPQPPSRSHSEGSSSSGEDSESLKHPDNDAGGKTQKGDPYSSKNRKKYRKATKQRKRSPTLKERFQWQPPSEDENESGVVVGLAEAHGHSPRDPEKAEKFAHGPDANDQEHKEKHRSSSDNNETDEDEAGLKDLEQKRTDLELRLAALTSHNRKIQEMMEGGGGGSDDGADKGPSVDDPQATKTAATSGFREADEPSLPLSNKGSELAPEVHSVSKDPSPKNQSAVHEDSPSKIQRKKGHSRSKSRSRTPLKRRPRSKSRSRSRSRDRRSPPRHSQRKKSASPSRKRLARSRSKSPRRHSRSPEKVTRRSPKKAARKASRSLSGSRSPTPRRSRSPRRKSPVRKSRRSRSASSSRSPSPALRRKRQPVSPRRSKSRSRSRGRKDRDRRRSVSRDRHRSSPRRVSPRRPSPRRPPPRRPSPRRRRRSRSPSPRRRRSRSISRTRRRSRSPLRRRRSAERSRSRSRTRRRRSPPRRDRSPRHRRRSNSRSSSGSSRSRSRSASRRRSRSYSRSSSSSYLSSRG